jgi:hypothetical protein
MTTPASLAFVSLLVLFYLQPFDVTSQSLEITNSDFTARKVAKRKEGEGGRESVT